MPFSQRSIDFLLENCLHDSRDWYNEHKPEYREFVVEPMKEFMEALRPTLEKIDGRIECDARRISRLFRDARYLRGRSLFRDNVWCSFAIGRGLFECPAEFYFDFSPEGYSYGLGWYQTPPGVMTALRELALEGAESFRDAKKAFEKQSAFEMGGDEYKKNHFPDAPEDIKTWINRRSIYFHKECSDWELFGSDSLAEAVARDYLLLAPVARFLAECMERDKMNANSIE